MDKIPVLRRQIKVEPEILPSSSPTPTLTGGIPPPLHINSVNELSNISTALSTFLNRYNDLQNHINFVNSSIDSLFTNPSQSALTHSTDTLCDQKLTEHTEAVISELNPNGTVSNCVRSCDDNVITHANPSDLKNSVETVLETSSDKNEAVVSEQNPNSARFAKEINEVFKHSEEINDVFKHSEEINDVFKNSEEINDVFKNSDEIDTLKKLKETETGKKSVVDVSKNPEGSDTLQKPVETDTSKRIEEISDVLKNSEEIDEKSKKPEEIDDILKKPEELDCSKKLAKTDSLKKPNEVDVSKKIDTMKKLKETETGKKSVVDVSKNPEGSDTLQKPVETDTSKRIEEISDVLKNSEEIDETSKKPEEIDDILKKPEELYCSKKLAKTDSLKKPNEVDVSKKIDTLKKLKETETGKKSVVDVSKNPEGSDTLQKPVETDTSKRIEEISDGLKNSEEIDETSKKPEEIDDILKKPEEIDDILKKPEELDCSKKLAKTDSLKKPNEVDVSKKIDTLKKLKETETGKKSVVDVSKNPEGSDTLQKPVETDTSKRIEEISDVLKNSEEIDETSKKPEELDCSKKLAKTDSLKKPNKVDVSKKPEELDSWKKPEELDSSKKPVEIYARKTPNEIDASKKPEELNSLKKLAETDDTSKKPKGSDVLKKPEEIDVSKKLEKIDVLKKPEETDILKKAEDVDALEKPEEADTLKKPVVSVLEFLCKNMCGRELRKHIGAHISEMNELREEIAKALKLAKDPAKLVLDSIGRFFLQGSRTYYNGANCNEQIVARLASVLILECFVTISSDDIDIAKGDKEYAAEAAGDWRRRMIKEGGLRFMDEVDSRGLLLLISGFGIPDRVFTNEDIMDLLRASNVKEISSTLRRSIILIPKIPEVINWMVKNNLEVEAADIAYTFGLEAKCHPDTILKTFLHKKSKGIHNGSPYQVNAANMQLLSDLKSVRRCLEAHKVDPSSLHLNFEISEKIQYLEQVLYEVNFKSTEENSTQKRKVKETEPPRNLNHHEAKRTCFSHEYVPHEQNYIDHYSMRAYNRSTQPSSSYFDQNLPNNYVTTYSAPSVYSASALPPNITSSVAGGLAGSYGTGIYGGPVVDPMMHTDTIQPYGWDEDSVLVSKYLNQPYSTQSQTYYSHPSTTGLYGRPPGWPPLESLPRLPDSSPSDGFLGRRGPSSDLYRFADTVVESESYQGSRAAGSGTTRPPYKY